MTLPALYQLSDELMLILDQVDETTGELPPEYGPIRDLIATKAEAVGAFILSEEAGAAMVHAAAIKLEQKAEAIERRTQRLREYLAENMARCGINRIEAADRTFSIKLFRERDVRVDVFDPAQLPGAWCWRYPPAPKAQPDKIAIKKALEAGEDVAGARILKSDRLVIA